MRLLLLFNFIMLSTCFKKYCSRSDPCWPSESQWKELGNSLKGSIHKLEEDNYQQCLNQGSDPFNISATGNGICMQYSDCSRQFCKKDNPWNIPAYSVEALNVEDIQKSIAFANKHNLPVTVKTSGHNFAGSSTGKDSLLIWMHNFESYLKDVDDVKKNYKDTCGTKYPHAVKIGGGQNWDGVYRALGSKYNIVGATCLTVSAAGGWLQGGGLSALSRKYGIGIDNVLSFEVVLANGVLAYADACTNPDLFWALRGGGGGTWGVVTSVHYKVYPAEPVIEFTMSITKPLSSPRIVNSWIRKWIAISPNLDRRWGGSWTIATLGLYFVGAEKDARSTFINSFEQWRECLPKSQINRVVYNIKKGENYFEVRGGEDEIILSNPTTGQASSNIANRLVPRDFVANHPAKAANLLKHILLNGKVGAPNYILGDAVTYPAADATAVHPAMREAVWQIHTSTDEVIEYVRKVVRNTGVGYNHASHKEPDWRNAFWGSNLNRLQCLKKQYDPENRFNCWHCVGYQGEEYE